VQRAWGNRPALLALTEKHRREGQARLAEMGIPADAGLICFHCREGGYSPHDEHSHSFRNCSVENYLPAIAELTKRGFWCIRMGDPSMRRIQPMERVIDYAHSDARSDWMDVFLCASCRFFLGSASGLIYLASVFGKPAGSANHAPLSTVMAFYGNDIAIPKLVWSESEGRYLTFSEVFGSDAGNFRYADLYQAHHLKPVENTAEDIRELALEMLERSENRAVYTPEDEELQLRFKALMRPGHYGYGGINRIGRAFLRKYAYLLGDRRG
jgi:putative glycosyltransferase (TIGR04372 family)